MKSDWKIYLLTMIGFLVGTVEFVIAGILNIIATDFHVPLAVAGQLITVFSLSFAIGTPILIAVTSRVDRKTLLLISLYLLFIGNVIAFLSWNIGVLLVSRIVLAIATGTFNVVGIAMASNLATQNKRGRAVATVIAGISSSLVLGVPIGRIVATYSDWHGIFAGIAVCSLLAIFAVGKFIPRMENKVVPLQKQINLLQNPKINASLLLTLFWIGGYSTVFTYISQYLSSQFHISKQGIALALFLYGIFSLIGSRSGGLATDRWGASRTLVASLLTDTLVLLLLAVTRPPSVVTLLLLMLWGGTVWATAPALTYLQLSWSPDTPDTIVSLNTTMIQFGVAAGALAGGVTINSFSIAGIGWVGTVEMFIASVVAISIRSVP